MTETIHRIRGGTHLMMIAFAVAMLCGTSRSVQAADDPLVICKLKDQGIELKTRIAIPLDNTGIARSDALNPRRPYPLVQPDKLVADGQDSCYNHLDKITLTFANRTDRYFGVQLSLNLKSGELLMDAYQRLEQLLKAPLPDGCRKALSQLDSLPAESSKLSDQLENQCRNYRFPSSESEFTREKLRGFLVDLDQAIAALRELPTWSGKNLPDLCKPDASARVIHCTPKLIVPPEGAQRVTGAILNLLDKGTATFTVTFENSADIPSNSTGYLQTAETSTEAPDSTKWQLSAQIGSAWDPDTGKKAEKKTFDTNSPFQGDRLQHFSGVGNFKVSQRLGNRATASATLGFKKGDLGEKDTTQQVTVPEYMVDFYGLSDLQLVFGKYTLAKPSDAVAVNVTGEGFELRLPRSFSLGYLVKRESAFGEADRQNRDNSLALAQLKNGAFSATTGIGKFLRTGSLIALYGREGSAALDVPVGSLPLDKDHCPQKDSSGTASTQQACYAYHYWTVGGEVAFSAAQDKTSAPPDKTFAGTLALYYSERKLDRFATVDTGNRVRDGRGYVGLFKPTYLRFKHDKLQYTVGAQLGYGSGGKATDRIDRGYLGESTAFAPDQIFLNGFAGHVSDGGNPTGKQALAPGLSNKSYLALVWTSPQFSLLEYLVKALQMNEAPASKSTTLKLNWYRFNQSAFASHDAGFEADLEFSVEIPKGITTTIDMGYFRPGEALRSVILKDVWAISASVKATI